MEASASMFSREHAELLDRQDPLRHLRSEFIIPSKGALRRKGLQKHETNAEDEEECVYFSGNSLGLQPRRTKERIEAYLQTWADKAVTGHFTEVEGSHVPPYIKLDQVAAERISPLVGARPSEVAVMETLTANLHLMMTAFYRPDRRNRWKVIMEGKAFPSDHYAVESQIKQHGLKPAEALVLIEPVSKDDPTLSTAQILSVIDEHASTAAMILLPGVGYFTGQLFDMARITQHAQAKGIVVGWDLAHAVGNVELALHDWNVDFAVWCNYKYMNAGAGAIAGLFVHERHGQVTNRGPDGLEEPEYRPRLSGWWGGDRKSRFEMGSRFVPIPGAAGYQLGNPSALDTTAVLASLEVFEMTSMRALRKKSEALTAYLEALLLREEGVIEDKAEAGAGKRVVSYRYELITPRRAEERGSQLSIRLLAPAGVRGEQREREGDPSSLAEQGQSDEREVGAGRGENHQERRDRVGAGELRAVVEALAGRGVVVDERAPDVVRAAPAALYNSFADAWRFVCVFRRVLCDLALERAGQGGQGDGEEKSRG